MISIRVSSVIVKGWMCCMNSFVIVVSGVRIIWIGLSWNYLLSVLFSRFDGLRIELFDLWVLSWNSMFLMRLVWLGEGNSLFFMRVSRM